MSKKEKREKQEDSLIRRWRFIRTDSGLKRIERQKDDKRPFESEWPVPTPPMP